MKACYDDSILGSRQARRCEDVHPSSHSPDPASGPRAHQAPCHPCGDGPWESGRGLDSQDISAQTWEENWGMPLTRITG